MFRVAVRKFGIRPAEAEPLVHDVFATFMMHSDGVRNVTAYLIGAMCNACRQYLRRSIAENALFCGEEPCAATPEEGLIEEIHRKDTLRRVLRRTGTRCRDLLHRYYIEGQSTSDIAAAYDTTPGTIQVFLHSCRERARKACGGERS
jgi:RNA polymerase sigma factor (sigma-70 family)